jgi:hypothetical protein
MSEEPRNEFRYRILRYTPNPVRDEWVNIGVLLEETAARQDGLLKRTIRVIEEQSEFARVRRLHPQADEGLLRALPMEFDVRLREPQGGPARPTSKNWATPFRTYCNSVRSTPCSPMILTPSSTGSIALTWPCRGVRGEELSRARAPGSRSASTACF